MSSDLAKGMKAMSIEEDEVPFDMPDLQKFCSSEKNTLSIIGRILNPDCQKMKGLILDMPRKWRIYDRVTGVALSKEKFQFIFKFEQDLEEVLSKSVWTYNGWTLAIERWVESPPTYYLQFLPMWIQIRNIPVNHYTIAAITSLGEIIGQVIEVAFDHTKAQDNDYVRVRVKFDVSKSLRRSKVVNFPSEKAVTVWANFNQVC